MLSWVWRVFLLYVVAVVTLTACGASERAEDNGGSGCDPGSQRMSIPLFVLEFVPSTLPLDSTTQEVPIEDASVCELDTDNRVTSNARGSAVKFKPVGPTADAVGAVSYLDGETQRYALELDATTPFALSADFPVAQGGYVEVEPGVHQFELVGNMTDCYFASWGWPGDAPNRIRIPVREGYRTYGSVLCDDGLEGF